MPTMFNVELMALIVNLISHANVRLRSGMWLRELGSKEILGDNIERNMTIFETILHYKLCLGTG